ncbi:hypothetical protein [Sphingomonas sp. DT-204]|uniref:hypothetical protein n=1 Tax=Sphingomonas sp. DT-204 TaxID=3396166 RepID=UPI003F1A2E1F
MPSDDLDQLVRDLSALPPADRASILAALTVDERAQVRAMMREASATVRSIAAGATSEHSRWFMELLESSSVTPAARKALAEVLATERPAGASPAQQSPRTLMQAAGRRLLGQVGQAR